MSDFRQRDFKHGPSHFTPIHHLPLIEFPAMLTCHGSDLFQHTPQMIDLLGIWGNLEASSAPWAHCHIVLAIPEQVLWWARAYRLVGGEDHRHEGLVLGPQHCLDGWCGARTQGFPAENCIVRWWSMLFTWPGCVWLYHSSIFWFSVSVPPSGWTGHNCMCIRGYWVTAWGN